MYVLGTQYDISIEQVIEEIRKPGDVYVLAYLARELHTYTKAVKSDLINSLQNLSQVEKDDAEFTIERIGRNLYIN